MPVFELPNQQILILLIAGLLIVWMLYHLLYHLISSEMDYLFGVVARKRWMAKDNSSSRSL